MIPLSLFDTEFDELPPPDQPIEPDWINWSLPFSPTLDPEFLYFQLGDYLDD